MSGKASEMPAPSGDWTWELRPGGWIVGTQKSTGKRVRVAYAERRSQFWAQLPGLSLSGEWVAPRRGGAGASSDADLVAQFPGKVRKILVKEGQQVAEGEPLVLVEAMKMEFSVKAPAAGKIKALRVKEGQQLQPGDRFLDLE
jgi:biotin carboxyl carrier protein